MKRYMFIILLSGLGFDIAHAQSVITLDQCVAWANEAHQFSQHESLIRQSQILALENDSKMYLPRLVLDGTATYQNENIAIQLPPLPGVEAPNVPLNFNRLLLNFSQTIYNGRLTAQKKIIDSLQYDTKAYQLEVDKSKLKAQITGLYSSIVLVNEQRQIIKRQIATLEAKARQLQGAVAAGVAYRSDLTTLRAEMLNLQQNATEFEYLERSLRQQLSILTTQPIPSTALFELPNIVLEETGAESRPELRLINSQQNVLIAQSDLSSASRMPQLGVFGNLGLGYPGYDIFNPSIRPMLLVGIKLNWQILDWHKAKNDQQLLRWNTDILSYQYTRVKRQFDAELIKQRQEIAKYEELITRDSQIIALRKDVTQDISARLSGGTATATDFIIQLNNEAVAELNESIHVIKLALAKISYSIIQGK